MTTISSDLDLVLDVLRNANGETIPVETVVEELMGHGHTVDSAVAVVEALITSGAVVLTNTYALQLA